MRCVLVREDAVPPATRACAHALFPAHWREIPGNSPARAWTQRPPVARLLALDRAGTLCGQLGLVALCTEPHVLGISDVVVAPQRRLEGIATAMLRIATVSTPATLLVDTQDEHLRRVLTRLGFRPVTDQAALCADGVTLVPPGWMIRGELAGLVLERNF